MVGVSSLLVASLPAVALAQEAGPPSNGGGGGGGVDTGGLASAVGGALLDALKSVLVDRGILGSIGTALLAGLGWLGRRLAEWSGQITDANVLYQLSPALTVDSPNVRALAEWTRTASFAAMGLVVTYLGYALLTRLMAPPEVGGTVGRLVLGSVLVWYATDLMGWLEKGANLVSGALAGNGVSLLTGVQETMQADAALGGVLLVYGLMALLLAIARLGMHALYSVLVVLAPIAALCYLAGFTGYATRWAGLVSALLVGQWIQAAALRLGAGMLTTAVTSTASQQTETQAVLTASVGIATLGLAIAAPSLVGAGVVSRGGRTLRRMATAAASRAHPAAAVASTAAGGASRAMPDYDYAEAPAASAHEVAPRAVVITSRPVMPSPRALPALPMPVD
jgi:hypothetical protein